MCNITGTRNVVDRYGRAGVGSRTPGNMRDALLTDVEKLRTPRAAGYDDKAAVLGDWSHRVRSACSSIRPQGRLGLPVRQRGRARGLRKDVTR